MIFQIQPASILNMFSKTYERVIKSQLLYGIENVYWPQISAYRKNYYLQHVLISLIEEWREHLDKDFVLGAVLTDLSRAFDCIPHDLLMAKLEAYGVGEKTLSCIYSHLTNPIQCVRTNDKKGNFQEIIFGVPQGSMARPIQFNFSMSDFSSLFQVHQCATSMMITIYLPLQRLFEN